MLPLYQIVYVTALCLACGFTCWAGGRTERLAVVIQVAASLASYEAAANNAMRWQRVMSATFLIDVGTSIAFMLLMLRSRRYWPIWSFGFSIAMVTAHLTRMLQGIVPPWSYYHTTGMWAYPVMITVLIGAVRYRWGARTRSF